MSDLEHFSVAGDRAEFRPRGEVSVHQGAELVTRVIARTRELGLRKLLLDITLVRGFDPPSLATRYHLVRQWAEAARGVVRVVFVSRPEMIDPGKFGVIAASNIGFQQEIFVTEEEAIRWLDGATANLAGEALAREKADSGVIPGAADPSFRGGK